MRERVASSEADVQWWEYDFARRQVVANLKAAYYDLNYSTKAMEVVEWKMITLFAVLKGVIANTLAVL